MFGLLSVASKEDVADFTNFADDGAVPSILNVAPEPPKHPSLPLEPIHFFLGGDPCGGVRFLHRLPQGCGVIAKGSDVFFWNLSELCGYRFKFCGIRSQFRSPFVNATSDGSIVFCHSHRIPQAPATSAFL